MQKPIPVAHRRSCRGKNAHPPNSGELFDSGMGAEDTKLLGAISGIEVNSKRMIHGGDRTVHCVNASPESGQMTIVVGSGGQGPGEICWIRDIADGSSLFANLIY